MTADHTPRKVLVTGASGLVGTAIVNALTAHGWHVLYCSRTRPINASPPQTWIPYDLSWRSLPENFGAGAEALVHAALDSAPNGRDRNVEGARLLLEAVRAQGVTRCIFISSFAARADAPSLYGRQKDAIEKLFTSPGDAIVRPGFVIGNGGLFQKLCGHLRSYRLVPLIDGGRQPMQTVLDEDLGKAVARIVTGGVRGTFDIAENDSVEYRTFWKDVARQLRVRAAFVSLPSALASAAIAVLGTLGSAGFSTKERLLGLRGMRYREPAVDSRVVPAALRRYDESIAITLARAAE